QPEDGIRDRNVTGVQTCALPISICRRRSCPICRRDCPVCSAPPSEPSAPTAEALSVAESLQVQLRLRLPRMTIRQGMEFLRVRADRKSTRLNSSHVSISYAVFCL